MVSSETELNGLAWRSRGENMRATRRVKMDAAFRGRRFEVVREVHLPRGQVFQTMFGNKGRHGYVIRDCESGQEMVVGAILLRLIHDRYAGVDLPVRQHRRKRGSPAT